MATNPFTWVNRRGSAAVQSTGVTVTADNVVFAFPNHAFATGWYRGTVFVNLAQDVPTGTTGTLPWCSRPTAYGRLSPSTEARR